MSRLPVYYLLLTVPVGVRRVVSVRRGFDDSPVKRKEFNKLVLRSVLIAVLIVSLVAAATVYMRSSDCCPKKFYPVSGRNWQGPGIYYAKLIVVLRKFTVIFTNPAPLW